MATVPVKHFPLREGQATAIADQGGISTLIKDTVEEVLIQLEQAPVRRRILRDEQACKYVGRDIDFLRRDRAEARRQGRPPLFAFRKMGSSILYDIRDLDAGLDALPRIAGQADLAA